MSTVKVIISLLIFAIISTVSGIVSVNTATVIVFALFGIWIWFILNRK